MTDEAEKRALEAAERAYLQITDSRLKRMDLLALVYMEASCRAYARSLNNNGVWISREDAAIYLGLINDFLEWSMAGVDDDTRQSVDRLRQQLGE